MLRENLQEVEQRIADACRRAGRKREEVTLIAVSKTKPVSMIREAMEAQAQTAADAEKWVELMKRYATPTELTAELLNTLIEKILVHEAVKNEDGSREQEVEIFYRFIGKID